MPWITNQHEIQAAAQRVRFCYLCGHEFAPKTNKGISTEHVVPKCLFQTEDWKNVVWARACVPCNGKKSGRDVILGQLVKALHGPDYIPEPEDDRRGLKLMIHQDDGKTRVILPAMHCSLHDEIFRWVRGFHALLYGQILPSNLRSRAVHPPAPVCSMEDDGLHYDAVLAQQPKIVEIIKRNRQVKNLDGITGWNGKLRYECAWDRSDRGPWLCFWALRLYEWEQLGDENVEQRGCCGVYNNDRRGKPSDATTAAQLRFPFTNKSGLDPFAR